jgi:hypothetical protein
LDIVNTAVRYIVVAFVFIGGAITLAGPQSVIGSLVKSADGTGEENTKNGLATVEKKAKKDSLQASI